MQKKSTKQTVEEIVEETTMEAVEEVSAAIMRLRKYEGQVGVADESGSDVALLENMKLYSGYNMNTEEVSYAWIDLDHVKLAKMDETSEIAIEKEDKKLEIQLKSGGLFFHVAEPLEEDETMEIRTSSMIVGIRGTSGWVTAEDEQNAQIHVLEGTVQVDVEGQDEPVAVSSGEYAEVTKTDGVAEVRVMAFPASDVPAYVVEEVVDNEELAQEILDAAGMDIARSSAAQDAYQMMLEQYRDACAVDHDDWMNNSPSYREQYAAISANSDTMLYYHLAGGATKLFYAYNDIDGNGVEELFVGMGSDVNQAYVADMYVFDGNSASRVNLITFEILADGTVIETDPAAAVVSVRRLAADGYTLENTSAAGLEVGSAITDWSFADFGGKMLFNWNDLSQ